MLQFDVGIRLYEHLSGMQKVVEIYSFFSYFVYKTFLFIRKERTKPFLCLSVCPLNLILIKGYSLKATAGDYGRMCRLRSVQPSRYLHFVHGLGEVGDDVVDVLDAYGQTYKVGGDACLAQLFVAELAVGVAGGVEDAGAGIGHVGYDADEVEVVHELDGFLTTSFQAEGDDAAGAVGHVFLGQFVVFVAGQAGIVHPTYLGVLFQPLGHLLGVLAVTSHA